MTEEQKKQRSREAAAERKRKQRAREKERDEVLGMAPTKIDLSDGERRMWKTQAAARGFEDLAEYFMSLILADNEALVMMGVDLSQFETTQENI